MGAAPKVSIIVPVYDTEAYLEQCLDSVLDQTLEDIEIICINDDSPDNSQAILERYAQKDKRIRVATKENGGLSSARNTGMKEARGNYIAFVDSDDFIAPEMMEVLYTQAEKQGADITIGNLYLYDNQTGAISEYRDPALFKRLAGKTLSLEAEPELIGCIGAWDRIYRRTFLLKCRAEFPEGLVYEDALFTAATLVKTNKITAVPQKLYYYRKNVPGSITEEEEKNDQYKQDFLEIQARIRRILHEAGVSRTVFLAYLVYFLNTAFVHQGNVVHFSFFKDFFQSVRTMMEDWEYSAAQKLCDRKRARYAAFLQKNHIVGSWVYFSFRRQARKARKWFKSKIKFPDIKPITGV